ncbi:hypothetical protein JYU16_00920 [bacterium AH-315-M05]|nr:hypothetical protein [bacterium AH-315-M05]
MGFFILTPFFINDIYSAGPPPPPDDGDPPCWPPPCIPIDGGIGFLIAAGIAYGGKKAFDSLKNK